MSEEVISWIKVATGGATTFVTSTYIFVSWFLALITILYTAVLLYDKLIKMAKERKLEKLEKLNIPPT